MTRAGSAGNVLLEFGYVSRARRFLARVVIVIEVVGVGNIRTERFKLAQKLAIVHERAARVLDQRSGHVIRDLTVVSLKCDVQVLRDALRAAGKHGLVFVGLGYS